jgi:hypothetical protein
MTSFAFLRTQYPTVGTIIRLALVAILLGCQPISRTEGTAQTKGEVSQEQRFFEPEVEIQKEDYAKVRRRFRTKLVRQGPAPQEWEPYQFRRRSQRLNLRLENSALRPGSTSLE